MAIEAKLKEKQSVVTECRKAQSKAEIESDRWWEMGFYFTFNANDEIKPNLMKVSWMKKNGWKNEWKIYNLPR